MTKVVFYEKDDKLTGFLIKDHSGYDDEGYDIVCASVSSAAYLTANTLTEIVGAKADIKVEEAYLKFVLKDKLAEAQAHLKGLKLHLESLAGDYDEYITCKTETV